VFAKKSLERRKVLEVGTQSTAGTQATAMTQATAVTPTAADMPKTVLTPIVFAEISKNSSEWRKLQTKKVKIILFDR
jgi:hypothetical protein